MKSALNSSKILLGLLTISLFAGCASVNSVSLTPIPANRGKSVRASAEKWIILGFNFDNDFIDPVVENLKNQCPNGVVSGILTKDETYSYFLVFRKQLTATGFCSSGLAKNGAAKRVQASTGSVE